jgi:hypothetical protein
VRATETIALDPAREILALLIDWCRIDHQSAGS